MGVFLNAEVRQLALDRLADIVDGADTDFVAQRLAAAEVLINDVEQAAADSDAHNRAIKWLMESLGREDTENQIRAAELLLRIPKKRRADAVAF